MILAIAVAILALAFLALVVAWGREVEPPQDPGRNRRSGPTERLTGTRDAPFLR